MEVILGVLLGTPMPLIFLNNKRKGFYEGLQLIQIHIIQQSYLNW